MGSYFDSTLLYAVATEDSVWEPRTKKYAAANPIAETPTYAARELLAGPISSLCTAHNKLLDATTVADAFFKVNSLPAVSGRTKSTQLAGLVHALAASLSTAPGPLTVAQLNQPLDGLIKTRMQDDLALDIARKWAAILENDVMKVTQPLGCFALTDLGVDQVSGALRGPNGRFSCDPKSSCSAAHFLHGKQADVQKLIAVLRPPKAKGVPQKHESVRRRSALKSLVASGPGKFGKKDCRAIGDAYFAVMCPPGSDVLTTNLSDHIPLCAALGKTAKEPPP